MGLPEPVGSPRSQRRYVVVVELLAPEHARESLAHGPAIFFDGSRRTGRDGHRTHLPRPRDPAHDVGESIPSGSFTTFAPVPVRGAVEDVLRSRRAPGSPRYQAAALVPVPGRIQVTVVVRRGRGRLTPSLGNGVVADLPNIRSKSVWFSHSSSSDPPAVRPDPDIQDVIRRPRMTGSRAAVPRADERTGSPHRPSPGVAEPHRRQDVQGVAVAGPRCATVTRIRMSVGPPWRSAPRRSSPGSSKTPVSSSSYSGSSLPRWRLTSRGPRTGTPACG